MRRTATIAGAVVVSLVILAGCGPDNASAPLRRPTVTDAAVCKAFNSASSPTFHTDAAETVLVRLASNAKNEDLRGPGEILDRSHDMAAIQGSKPFSQIGAACVSLGFTSSDWAELA